MKDLNMPYVNAEVLAIS